MYVLRYIPHFTRKESSSNIENQLQTAIGPTKREVGKLYSRSRVLTREHLLEKEIHPYRNDVECRL